MKPITIFLMLLLVGFVAYGAYYWGSKNKTVIQPSTTQMVDQASPSSTEPSIPTVTQKQVDEKPALIVAVRQGLVAKHGGDAGRFVISVSAVEGEYASGGVTEVDAVGGAMWLAVKVNGNWRLVWDGNGTISCDLIVTYPEFPKTLIPECWNEQTGKNVVR